MAAIVPTEPGTPTRKSATEDSITIEWTAPTDDGGTDITDYHVWWDNGTGGSFVFLDTSMNLLEYYEAGPLDTGKTYRFKVYAENFINLGTESGIGSIIAATVPDPPVPAPTRVSSTKTSITISWTAPYNGGSPILGYKIFMNGGGISSTYTDVTNSGTLDNTLRTFTSATTLTTGLDYKFKVLAYNAVEDGNASTASDPIYSAIVPTAPQAVQKQTSTETSVTVEWTAPADIGGSPLTEYVVYSNGGGTSTTFSEVGRTDDLVLSF